MSVCTFSDRSLHFTSPCPKFHGVGVVLLQYLHVTITQTPGRIQQVEPPILILIVLWCRLLYSSQVDLLLGSDKESGKKK